MLIPLHDSAGGVRLRRLLAGLLGLIGLARCDLPDEVRLPCAIACVLASSRAQRCRGRSAEMLDLCADGVVLLRAGGRQTLAVRGSWGRIASDRLDLPAPGWPLPRGAVRLAGRRLERRAQSALARHLHHGAAPDPRWCPRPGALGRRQAVAIGYNHALRRHSPFQCPPF